MQKLTENDLSERLKLRSVSLRERFLLYLQQSELFNDRKQFALSLKAMRNALKYQEYGPAYYRQMAFNNCGMLYLELKRPRAAFGQFLNCLRINHWHPIANRSAAQIFISQGYPYPAMFLLVRAARHRYCRQDSFRLIIECLENAGHRKFAGDISRLSANPERMRACKTLQSSQLVCNVK